MDISGLDISYLDINGLDISYLDKRSLDISGLDTGSGLERSCMVRVRVMITWHKNMLGLICWVLFCAGVGWPFWRVYLVWDGISLVGFGFVHMVGLPMV